MASSLRKRLSSRRDDVVAETSKYDSQANSILHEGISDGNLQKVKYALSQGAHDHKTSTTLLMIAIRNGDNEIVQTLLDHGAPMPSSAMILEAIEYLDKIKQSALRKYIEHKQNSNHVNGDEIDRLTMKHQKIIGLLTALLVEAHRLETSAQRPLLSHRMY